MSRWKLYDHWYADLPTLSPPQLHERRELAASRLRSSLARGPGRNPKAARDWRERLRAVEEELTRRGVA
ncbi:hypothetical protein ABZX85_21460 [Streptomyces sp. NPDC004539]|uniref:hypothetical protein n=1 Tax=Streptomyces sp. NPDC004539 TaxID=3154280 RepID=UPI0033AAC633